MKRAATLGRKNQVTIPAEVRRALGLSPGDAVIFDVDGSGAEQIVTLRRSPRLEELAGSVPVPEDVAGLSWEEVRARAWTDCTNIPETSASAG